MHLHCPHCKNLIEVVRPGEPRMQDARGVGRKDRSETGCTDRLDRRIGVGTPVPFQVREVIGDCLKKALQLP
jgi:hypothetical protein